jgi:hypothetical protein
MAAGTAGSHPEAVARAFGGDRVVSSASAKTVDRDAFGPVVMSATVAHLGHDATGLGLILSPG